MGVNSDFIQNGYKFSKYNKSMDAILSCFACSDKASSVVESSLALGFTGKKSLSRLNQNENGKPDQGCQ